MSFAVAVVAPQAEAKVAKAIADLGLGFDVFNPKIRLPKVHRGRRVYHVEPMFRRYLLVKMCDQIREINRETVRYFISFITTIDHTLALIPDRIVVEIKSRCTGDDVLVVPRSSRFMQGELVRPTSGAFVDRMLRFEESLGNRDLATTFLFGREVILSFRKSDLVAA